MTSPLIPFSPASAASPVAPRPGAAAADAATEPGAFAQAFQRSNEALRAPTVARPGPTGRPPEAGSAGRDRAAEAAGPASDPSAPTDPGSRPLAAGGARDGDSPQPGAATNAPDGDTPRSRHAQRRAGTDVRQPLAGVRPRTPRSADEGTEGGEADGVSADRAPETQDSLIAEDISLAAGIVPPATATPATLPATPSTLSLEARLSPAGDEGSAALPAPTLPAATQAASTLPAATLPAATQPATALPATTQPGTTTPPGATPITAAAPPGAAAPISGDEPATARGTRRTAAPGLSPAELTSLGARRLPLAGSERATPAPAAGPAQAASTQVPPAADDSPPAETPRSADSRRSELRRAGTEGVAAQRNEVSPTAAAPAGDTAAAPDIPAGTPASTTAGIAASTEASPASGPTPSPAAPATPLPPAPQALPGSAARGKAEALSERSAGTIDRSDSPAAGTFVRASTDEPPAARGDRRGPRGASSGRGTDAESESAARSSGERRATAGDTAAAPVSRSARGDDPRGEQHGASSTAAAIPGGASATSPSAGSSLRFADQLQSLMPGAGNSAPPTPNSPQASSTPLPTSQLSAHLNSPEFSPSLGAQITLLARQGVQQARIELNPADMGPITVRIAVEGSGAQVDFQADRAATRQVIESSLPALAGALRESGLTLTGGGVFQPPADGGNLAGSFAGNLAGNGQGSPGGNASGQSSGAPDSSGGRPGWPGGGDEHDLPGSSTVIRAGLPRGLVDLVA